MENKFCVGTPECVKNEFNNYCKPVEHVPTRPTDCEEGGAVGKNLGVLYREALSTGQASPAALRQSAECLLKNLKPEKVPVKLYCTYKSAIEHLEKVLKEVEQKGVKPVEDRPLNKEEIQQAFHSNSTNVPLPTPAKPVLQEGTFVEPLDELPVFSLNSNDLQEKAKFESAETPALASQTEEPVDSQAFVNGNGVGNDSNGNDL
jgi:hypothetical protein